MKNRKLLLENRPQHHSNDDFKEHVKTNSQNTIKLFLATSKVPHWLLRLLHLMFDLSGLSGVVLLSFTIILGNSTYLLHVSLDILEHKSTEDLLFHSTETSVVSMKLLKLRNMKYLSVLFFYTSCTQLQLKSSE